MPFSLDDRTREDLARLCRKYSVRRLKLFGSAATEHFQEQASDLDLVVEFGPAPEGIGLADQYFEFREELTKMFGRPVDLLEEHAIENSVIREAVVASSVVLYAA